MTVQENGLHTHAHAFPLVIPSYFNRSECCEKVLAGMYVNEREKTRLVLDHCCLIWDDMKFKKEEEEEEEKATCS